MTEPPERRYSAQPYQPGVPFSGGMSEIQTTFTRVVRPPVVVVAFAMWLLAVLSWPLGRMAVRLGGGEPTDRLFWVGNVFLLVCVLAAVGFPLVRFLKGSHMSRVVLTIAAVICEVLALGFLIASIQDDVPVLVALQVVRMVFAAVAVVLSFLPQVRNFFATNLD